MDDYQYVEIPRKRRINDLRKGIVNMTLKDTNESSLSRVKKHADDDDTTIVIFTAFSDEHSREDNISANKYFASKLKNAGFGYFYVNGYFPENEGKPNETNVKEDSIFAISKNNKGKQLIDLCHKLANSRNQDSIIVKSKDGVYFLDKNKNKTILHDGLKVGKIGKYYTQLRNKKTSNTFVFEQVVDGKGYFQLFREYIKGD